MPDANLAAGMPSIITFFFGCAGEHCLSGSVLVAVGSIYDELQDRFVAAAKALRVGNSLEEGIQMGPVISQKHHEKVLGYVGKGIQEGATLILDGRGIQVSGHPRGYYIGPTVFGNVSPDMAIAREKAFGPLVSIVRVRDLDEGIRLIQSSEYGNTACLYTSSGKTARESRYRVPASMIGINIGIAAPMAFFPFGETRVSFFGDIKGRGREITQSYTDTKVVIQRWL